MGTAGDVAQLLGIGHADSANGLANFLPHVIDHLTPNGTVQDDLVQQGLALAEGQAARPMLQSTTQAAGGACSQSNASRSPRRSIRLAP